MQPVGESTRISFRGHLPAVNTEVNTTEVDSEITDPVDNAPAEEIMVSRGESPSFPSYVVPEVLHESSIAEPLPADAQTDISFVAEYRIVSTASQRSRDVLTDNRGYTFTLKRRGIASIIWRCSVRNIKCKCGPTVIQRGSVFKAGRQPHIHPPKSGIEVVTKVNAILKKTTKTKVFASGAKIVDDVLLENVQPDNMPDYLSKYANLVRTANRQREQECPKHPSDLQFEVAMDHITANFLVSNLKVEENHHLLFVTLDILQFLHKEKTWDMDGTFKVVRAPFTQLFQSIPL